jgi:hypothetical protein
MFQSPTVVGLSIFIFLNSGFMNLPRIIAISIFLLLVASVYLQAQSPSNKIGINASRMFFQDWKFSTTELGGYYTRQLSNLISIGGSFQYTFRELQPNVFDYTNYLNFGEVKKRNLHVTDLNIKFTFLRNSSGTLLSSLSGGFSYIWGGESTLINYLTSPPASFPHAIIESFNRHHPGLNFSWEMDFLPNQIFDLESSLKVRIYTKGSPDLSVGLNIGFQFNDPKFVKKKGSKYLE